MIYVQCQFNDKDGILDKCLISRCEQMVFFAASMLKNEKVKMPAFEFRNI